MLSPDRNDSPKRGWMLAAAAVAGLALVGGLVFATANSDDDTVPADAPTATLPVEPAPDAEVEPDADAVVVPAPDPTTAAEVAPEPEPEPVTVTLTGTFSMTKEFKSVPSRTGVVGDQTWVGNTRFEGQISGTAYDTAQVWNLPDGSSFEYTEGDLTAEIDGLGVGSLNYRGSAQTIDGVWSSESVIASGTAAFEGASGTLILTPDPATPTDSSTGTYEWTITVPPKGSLVTVAATGQASASVNVVPESVPLTWTGRGLFSGSLVGSTEGSGQGWANPSGGTFGSSRWVFTGTIDGLGTGTMTFDRLGFDPPAIWFDVVVGGTGDFEGITGTGQVAADGSYTYTLTAPVNQ